MDPNETLKELREIISNPHQMDRARELFGALDEWLTKGGFYPKDWDSARLMAWSSGYRAGRDDAMRDHHNPGMGS